MTSALGKKEVKQRSLCFCACINLFQDLPAERALVRIRENELQEAHNHPQSKHEWSALFETQVFNPLDPDGDADYQAIMFFPNKCCQVQCDAHDPQDFNGFQCGIIFKDDVFLFWFLCHLSGRWKVFHLAGKPLCLQDKTQKSEGWYWMGIGTKRSVFSLQTFEHIWTCFHGQLRQCHLAISHMPVFISASWCP